MDLMFIGHFSKFVRIFPALSAAKESVSSLYFIVISVKIKPEVRPIVSSNVSVFVSSNKNTNDACFSEELLLDSISIDLLMAVVFAIATCKQCVHRLRFVSFHSIIFTNFHILNIIIFSSYTKLNLDGYSSFFCS